MGSFVDWKLQLTKMSRHRDWDIACKVYIGNLGNNASKYEIEDAFGKYGPLRNVWVARNPPGFAFVEFADPSVVDVVTVVAVDAEAAPEAVAGNVVGLDDLPLTDQCRGVAVDQLHHPEDEGLAQPLVRIKTEAEVNLKTILWFLFFWHAKCILSCLSCSRSFCHYYFVLHTYRVSIKQYTIHFLLNKRLRLAAAMY